MDGGHDESSETTTMPQQPAPAPELSDALMAFALPPGAATNPVSNQENKNGL